MSVFTVDTEAVATAQGSTRATMERLQSESATLMAQLTQLESSWSGAASVAFQNCAQQWRGAQLHVEQVLESIGTALGGAATQYADADQYSASLFR
ncbi:MAG: WXG100 family type VII secretion target [Microbacterium sp.]|uniref:ESAT-6-like protein n=1 Tax=Microbacterium natoriense TaxID=284570 RepID=A0AAW8F3J6_9MICO|nr:MULTISPECIES: WXG100 family type VII secretion target [Microbacterium]MBW8762183.1 WXG100 family type VII secretion target [Microbacterium sp.]MDQ0649127.1 early secretory antigenic target protein ESAT-6 [Microbacterium natoriense]